MLPILERIFHVCVLIVALRWSLRLLSLAISLYFLVVFLIAFVVSVATTGFAATTLTADIALSLRLAFGWLHLGLTMSFVAFLIRTFLEVIPIASPALAAGFPIMVAFMVAITLLVSVGTAAGEILIAGSVIVVIAHLGLIGHSPHGGFLFTLFGSLRLILDLLYGAREGWLFCLELDTGLALSLLLVDFLARGLGLVLLWWTIVSILAVAFKVIVGLALVPWLLVTLLNRLDLVICPELKLFVLFFLPLLLLLLHAVFVRVVFFSGNVTIPYKNGLVFKVVDSGVTLGLAEGSGSFIRREFTVACQRLSLLVDLKCAFGFRVLVLPAERRFRLNLRCAEFTRQIFF